MKPALISAGLIACALLAMGVGSASAGGASHPTTITIYGFDEASNPPDLIVNGRIGSTRQKCIAGRTVKIYFVYPGGQHLVDTDTTSTNGDWSGEGDGTSVGAAKIVVTKSTFGPKGHRSTCNAAHALFA